MSNTNLWFKEHKCRKRLFDQISGSVEDKTEASNKKVKKGPDVSSKKPEETKNDLLDLDKLLTLTFKEAWNQYEIQQTYKVNSIENAEEKKEKSYLLSLEKHFYYSALRAVKQNKCLEGDYKDYWCEIIKNSIEKFFSQSSHMYLRIS